MSKKDRIEVSCPECSERQTVIVWNSLNVSLNPEANQDLLNNRLNLLHCKKCGVESPLDISLLYHNFMKILIGRKKPIFIVALILVFFFRLAYGLCLDFRSAVGDERQIYLIGLKYHTTGEWPYFGPDVTNTIQIPGALQGLVVGLPWSVLPTPEAPYILLNILSFFSLCFLLGIARNVCLIFRTGLSGPG